MTNPLTHRLLAQSRIEDFRRAAAAHRRGSADRAAAPIEAQEPLTLRYGFPDDEQALGRLAALDSAAPLRGPVLLAEVGSELRAALSLADRRFVANPFLPTAALVELLQARARQLEAERSGPRASRPRRRLRLGLAAWR